MGDRETRDVLKKLDRTPKKENMKNSHGEVKSLEVALKSNLNLEDENRNSVHPIFKQISLVNGQINKMDINALRKKCRDLNINNMGKREAVKRRLKEYYKVQMLIKAGLMEERHARYGTNPDYFVVIDFEATCEERNPAGYPHEIIEFPAVLVNTATMEIEDVFHSFVRPVINPQLSEFCKNLTGIDQETVDTSPPFKDVNDNFIQWLQKRDLGIKHTFNVITDGPFDMGRFLWLQCRQSEIKFPRCYAGHWVNIRKTFSNFYKMTKDEPKLPSLQVMLDSLGLEFEGSPHSGLDDAKNIARILIRLLEDRAIVRINEKITNVSNDKEDDNRGPARLSNVASVNRKEAETITNQQKKMLIS